MPGPAADLRASLRPPAAGARAARCAVVAAMPVALAVAAVCMLVVLAAPGRARAEAAPAATQAAAPGAASGAPPTLAALLAGFRTMPGFEARFEEEKTLALLAAPLASRGRLYFAPPATLLRRVESPNPHDILIDDHVVRIATPTGTAGTAGTAGATGAAGNAGTAGPGPAAGSPAAGRRIETIDLARRADVRPLVESMLWIFSGDLAQLESIYAIDYQVLAPASSGRWQLRLAPRREPLSRLIRELAISGHRFGADRLEVTETSGDRTTTRILDANPARRFEAGELGRLFGLGAP